MTNKQPEKVVFSRPKDKSLEAYRAWVMNFMRAIVPSAKDDKTEEQWIESWKKFWSKAEKPSD